MSHIKDAWKTLPTNERSSIRSKIETRSHSRHNKVEALETSAFTCEVTEATSEIGPYEYALCKCGDYSPGELFEPGETNTDYGRYFKIHTDCSTWFVCTDQEQSNFHDRPSEKEQKARVLEDIGEDYMQFFDMNAYHAHVRSSFSVYCEMVSDSEKRTEIAGETYFVNPVNAWRFGR